MIEAGKINNLGVLRKSDIGYMLTDGSSQVLLHFNEATKELRLGDKVDVFIYFDKQHRPCASMSLPRITIDKPGFAEVVETLSNLGVFVNIGSTKDVLVSKDNLPYDEDLWPNIGDKLIVRLKIKHEMLIAKPLGKQDIIDLKNDNVKYALDDEVGGYVCRTGNEGIGICSNDFQYIFVYKTHLRGKYRLGEEVNPKIILIKKDEYNATLTENKEYMIDEDQKIIIDYMKIHKNKMKITSKSSSELVERELRLSRNAFKRALGGLYKSRKVRFDGDYTILVEEKEDK